MTSADEIEYPELYLRGIEYFNDCDFFEAHECWEEYWTEYRGPSREFYQGLIQVAVAFHHFVNENIRGARKVYISSRRYLEPFGPKHHGIDLEKLLAEFEQCFAEVLASNEEFPQLTITPDLIPDIVLDPAPPEAADS